MNKVASPLVYKKRQPPLKRGFLLLTDNKRPYFILSLDHFAAHVYDKMADMRGVPFYSLDVLHRDIP